MSLLFPLGFQYKQDKAGGGTEWSSITYLFVNPTDIAISKRPSIAETRTMGGTVFQPWVNQPDEVTFKGVMYGTRAIHDFRALQKLIDGKPSLREVNIIYKWRVHSGYVKSLSVEANSEKPRMFDYSFVFLSKKPFSLTRLMLGQTTSTQTEVDWGRAQLIGLRSLVETISKDPISGVFAAVAIANAGANYFVNNLAEDQKLLSSDPENEKLPDMVFGTNK